MRTLKCAAQLVDVHARWLITQGRLGFTALDKAVDWVDDEFGAVPLGFVLDRYAELVSAGQGS